jgi:putative transposase
VEHVTARFANNRAELSYQPARQIERQMRKFKCAAQAQRFLSVHGVVRNLFSLGWHRLRFDDYRMLRGRTFAVWSEVAAA